MKSVYSLSAAALAAVIVARVAPAHADDTLFTPAQFSALAITADWKLDPKACSINMTVDQDKFASMVPKLVDKGVLGNNGAVPAKELTDHITMTELGWTLQAVSLSIQALYTATPLLNQCHVSIRASVLDDFGNSGDHDLGSFDFDRALFKRVNWDTFNAVNLMKVGHSFKLSPYFLQQAEKEED